MDTSGLDVSAWLTLLAVAVMFFVLPMAYLEVDRRKRFRAARSSEQRNQGERSPSVPR